MRKCTGVALGFLFVCSSVLAQSTFIPKGYGSVHGRAAGETWDAHKSRRVILIDRSQFWWGAGNVGVVNGFRLRRTGGVLYDMVNTQRTIRVRGSATRTTPGSSTPTGPGAANPQTTFQANHGAAVPTTHFNGPVVFSNIGNGRLLKYYQSFAVPIVPGPAFPQVTFTTPLVVPADAETLVLDIEVEDLNGSDNQPVWRPEEVATWQPSEYVGGFRRFANSCIPSTVPCSDGSGGSAPCMDRCEAIGMYLGATFETRFRVGKGGETMLGWLGGIPQVPIVFPGVSCPLLVDPFGIINALGVSNDDPNCSTCPNDTTEVSITWATIPNAQVLVGLQFGVQFAAFPSSLSPDGVALSGAYELTIGSPPTGQVQYSTMVSACDDNGYLFGVPSCSSSSDPFSATAVGSPGSTPVLQLF